MGMQGRVAGMHEKRLLVCDDEPAFGRFVKNVAEESGYQVEVTTTWQAFMQAYLTFRPATIVLDIVMPGMDGIELVGLRGRRHDGRRFTIAPRSPDLCSCEKNLSGYVN
jgi:CheY-like chemotaxis protein